jgi:hypothetical protein
MNSTTVEETTMKRNLFTLAAAAAFVAMSTSAWAADDTVKQSGAAQTPARAPHDARMEQSAQKQDVHTGPTDKPARAAHDLRAEEAHESDAEHVMSDPETAAQGPGRADHATKERAKQEHAQ